MVVAAGGGADGKDEDELSPEDAAAWADSCLAKDDRAGAEDDELKNLSDDRWAVLTEAFITALASLSGAAPTVPDDQNQSVDKSSDVDYQGSTGIDASGGELISSIAAAAPDYAGTLSDHPFPGGLGGAVASSSNTAAGIEEIGGESGARLSVEAVVIGSEFPEQPVDYGDDDGDEFSVSLGGEEGAEVDLAKDIFKVWDLRIPGEAAEEEEEEDELSSMLKNALEQSSADVSPAAADPGGDQHLPDTDNMEQESLQEADAAVVDDLNLGELISAIGDLSLRRPATGGE
ncbi:unnamed protein product [Spirodela intermedia]|uniref:Uncharacterized protein n=1 Tax=Spirodela intermedia TaxID=51605 RepID=A0A7I8LE86_SPIIN|nr:unnamed protein product [Spirodela intermedia]